MTDNHPITPPPELVRQWMERTEYDEHTWFYESYIAEQAARWGADQELEACCEWLVRNYNYPEVGNPLRDARRPEPPSLKEQALQALDNISIASCVHGFFKFEQDAANIIRQALEQLND